MNAKDRNIVFNKYGGRCAYCGCELGKGWCVDHIEPIGRRQKRIPRYYRNKTSKEKVTDEEFRSVDKWWEHFEEVPGKLVPNGCDKPELDTVENSNPACFSCNSYKSSYDLETFREQVGLLVARLNKSFNQYKISKRYGLVVEVEKPVIFYFETLNLTHSNN